MSVKRWHRNTPHSSCLAEYDTEDRDLKIEVFSEVGRMVLIMTPAEQRFVAECIEKAKAARRAK